MAVRALIIAVERYPALREPLTGDLTGTLQTAERFRDWLVSAKGAAGKDILFCSEPASPHTTSGASKREIRKALLDLRAAGAGDTEECYFFFSGHGFAQTGLGGRATSNVLLPADYEDPDNTGDLPLKHDEIIALLQSDLGPGTHFHFIDACRYRRSEDKFPAGVLGIPSAPQSTGQATAHVLYATLHGAGAGLRSGFGPALIEGLQGMGRAKTWQAVPGQKRKLVVRFESLVEFIRARLKNQTPDAEPGGVGSDVLYEFHPPVPAKTCTITVANAGAQDAFHLRLSNADQDLLVQATFQGTHHHVARQPEDYFIEVTSPRGAVEPAGWVPVDLYEDTEAEFRLAATSGGGAPPPPPPPVTGTPLPGEIVVALPHSATAELSNVARGLDFQVDRPSATRSLPAGHYELKLRDRDGVTVRRRSIEVRPGGKETVDLSEPPPSRLHGEILGAVRGSHQPGAVDFSETLFGPIVDQDPALWLAMLGSAHIVGGSGSAGRFSKLRHLPLADFAAVPRNGSALYVMMGLEVELPPLKVGLATGPTATPNRWTEARVVDGFTQLAHHQRLTKPGPGLLSLAIGADSVLTLATAFLPNRATLVTITQDRSGALQTQAMLLPIQHLIPHLPATVQDRVFSHEGPLRNVKFIVQAQRSFRKRLDLGLTRGPGQKQEWLELLYAKWLDPVMAALACYELIRRGVRDGLNEAIGNLQQYFPDFPDTAALARLAGVNPPPPRRGWPLFLEGLAAFPDYQTSLPLPASKLDYRGMWTLWRGAVRNPHR